MSAPLQARYEGLHVPKARVWDSQRFEERGDPNMPRRGSRVV